jgi:hypothetical protein
MWVVLGCAAADMTGENEGPPPEAMLECDEYESLALGRCVRESDGEDCTGDPEETMIFVALEEQDPMRMVVGPQAATMLVFLAQTSGIDPGDPDDPVSQDNPLVEAEMVEDDERLSEVVLRSSFSEDADSGQLRSDSGLFLVVEEEDYEVIGKTYEVTARITDKDELLRCGRVNVTIEANPDLPNG